MKSSIFVALVGAATASSLRSGSDNLGLSTNMKNRQTETTTTYTTSSSVSGADGLQTYLPAVSVGGKANLNGVSDLAVTSLGSGSGISSSTSYGAGSGSLSGSGGLSNIGTGSVLLTSATTGKSALIEGKQVLNNAYPRADIGGVVASSSNNVNNNVVAAGLINTVLSNTNANANLNMNQLFTKLPSLGDIDSMILNADSVGLLKTVQVVGADNSIPCDQRIAFLLELDGRLKSAIEKKIFNSEQLKVVINSAQSQTIRLQILIDQNNADIDRLGLNNLNNRLNGLIKQMQGAYTNFNVIESQIPVLEAQVSGNEKQIDILIKNSDKQRNRIANDRLKLNQILAEIASLSNKLKELQDQQAAVTANIQRGQANIAKNNQAIIDIRNRIDGLQLKLRGIVDNSDNISSQIRQLEVKVGRIRTDISVSNAKKNRLLKDNDALNDRITIQRRKNVSNDLTKLNGMIANLQTLIPTIQSEVDRHFYYCFGDGKVQVTKTGDVVVYVVRGDAFGNYLRNLYGRNIVLPAVNGDVLFNRIDIFGAPWVGAFGYPFLNSSLGGNDLTFAGSFGCTNPTAIMTGSGVISALGSNWIQFTDGNGKISRANLGSCSRLQSTKKLPVIGQKFYWSGVPASEGFNVYSASCFD